MENAVHANAMKIVNFLSDVDLRQKSKDEMLFFQRMKAFITGNVEQFPTQVDGLISLTDTQLGNAGLNKTKFQNLGDLNWEYEKRAKTVVDDPIKREMVRDWFEQDSITVESELPRSREIVEVDGSDCLRRYFRDSVDNLVTRFLEEKPEFGASRRSCKKILESFKHFRFCSEDERIHSACQTCRQLEMFCEGVNRSAYFDEINLVRDQLVRFSVCEGPISEVTCIENRCPACKDNEGERKAVERLERLVSGSLMDEITWVELKKDAQGRECESQRFGTLRMFIESVAKYVAFGGGMSGTGRKTIAHVHRLMDMQLERRNIFKQLEEDKELLVLEIDHGEVWNVAVIGM